MTEVAHKDAIERALSSLANTMRLYVEAHWRFGPLFAVDHEEAINNLDRAFEAKLEAFHRLYDVSKTVFAYFEHGDTTLLIAVRNAVHHADHPLFRSLKAQLFLDDGPTRWLGASFLLASYPTLHGAALLMSHYVRLNDVDLRLNPKLGSAHLERMRVDRAAQRFELIDGELALGAIRQKAKTERYPESQVYLDLMPVFASGVSRTFTAMNAAGFAFKGFDADVYVGPFTSEIAIDLSNPTFSVRRVLG
jgi:hypothetical protein